MKTALAPARAATGALLATAVLLAALLFSTDLRSLQTAEREAPLLRVERASIPVRVATVKARRIPTALDETAALLQADAYSRLSGAAHAAVARKFGLQPLPGARAGAFAPVLAATLSDAHLLDADADAEVSPGDRLRYTAQISNTGDETATGVSFTLGLGANLSLVPGSIAVAPLAFDDAYETFGNTRLEAAVSEGLFKNDVDLTGESDLLIAAVSDACAGEAAPNTANCGTVAVNPATGAFTYDPPAGFSGTDTFTYTLTDGTGLSTTGTVTITVGTMVWYVEPGAPTGGDGTSARPFNAFTALDGGEGDVDAPGQTIYLYAGTTAEGFTLEADQRLVGQGEALVVTDSQGNPQTLIAAGAAPTVGPVVLATNNTVAGLSIAASGAGQAGLTGTAFGTLTARNLSVSTDGGPALNLTTGAIADGSTFGTLSAANATTNGLRLSGVTGSITATGAITMAADATGAAVEVVGGSVNVTYPGSVGQPANQALVSVSAGHTGTLTFDGGALQATSGTGLQLSDADGTYHFSTTGGSLTLAGGDAGIDIANGSSGTIAVATAGGVAAITNPASEAIRIVGSAPTFTYGGTVTKTNGASTAILVQNNTGGTITFSGPSKTFSTGSAPAVNLSGNTGASINFTGGGLAITTTTGSGLNATGGGTVAVTGANNTISSAGGVALNVQNTTIAAAGLTFERISASGGSNGILLQNTGTSGGLTVTGTGTVGSGGTITGSAGGDGATAGNGVYLENTQNVSLSWMNVSNTANNGIFGTGVRGLVVDRSRFTGTHGTSNSGTFDESAVGLTNVGGTVRLTNSLFNGGAFNAVRIENMTGTAPALNLVMEGDTVTSMQGSTADVRSTAFLVNVHDGTADVQMRNNYLTYWWGNAIHVLVQGTASGRALITGNTAHQTSGALAGAGGISAGGGNLTYNISNNSVRFTNGTAISVDRTTAGATMQGTIENNTIGLSGVANSGSETGSGIFASHRGPGVTTVRISNNTIRQVNGTAGISTITGDAAGFGGSGTINATIAGNDIREEGTATSNARWGILITHGVTSSAPGDSDLGCYDIGGAAPNVITNWNTSATIAGRENAIRVNQRFNTTSRWPGYTGAATGGASATDMATYLLSRNMASNSLNSNSSTGGFLNTSPPGSACPQPATLAVSDFSAALESAGADNGDGFAFGGEAASHLNITAEASLPDLNGTVDAATAVDSPKAVVPTTPVLLASTTWMAAPTVRSETFMRALRGAALVPSDTAAMQATNTGAMPSSTCTVQTSGATITLCDLPAGKSVTVVADADIASPLSAGATSVSAQGSLASTSPGGVIASDDPNTGAANDATITPLTAASVLAATLTSELLSDANGDEQAGPGDVLAFTATITNTGNQDASGVSFTLDPSTLSPLLTGSVATTSGTVTTGNTVGDTTIAVNVGVVGGGTAETVTFQVAVPADFPAGVAGFSTQGTVSATDLASFPTDDPATPDAADATETTVNNPFELVVNEVDVDQGLVDDREFIELMNPSETVPVDLGGYAIRLVDESGPEGAAQVYRTIALPAVELAAGAYFVVCADNPFNTQGCDLKLDGVASDFIADDGPAAVALWHVATRVVSDVLSYAGAMQPPYAEGTGAPTDDGALFFQSLSRLPDGADTDDNGSDFGFVCVTPGTANANTVVGCDDELPVELTSFTGIGDEEGVVLSWHTASETNNAGFEVEHQAVGPDTESPAAYRSVGFVAGGGTTAEAQTYSFRVESLAPGVHRFRLRQIDVDGAIAYSPVVELTVEVPRALTLTQSHPNPFNAGARFHFTVPAAGSAEVVLYNSIGQEVAVLFRGEVEPGRLYDVQADASALSAGVYVYVLRSGGRQLSRSMIVAR